MDNGCKDVRHWLASYQLQDFTPAFISNGFIGLRQCCHLTEEFLSKVNVPPISHALLLDASRKLRFAFPDYYEFQPIMKDEDIPPPLPEKKNRRSLPSPIVRPRREEGKPRSSMGNPPSAPPRSSQLRRSIVPAAAAQVTHNSDKSAELHLMDLIPPPPPMEPGIIVTTNPPSPKPKKSQDISETKQFLQSMPQDCQSFLSSDYKGENPALEQSAYYDLDLITGNTVPSPVVQKKPKPAVKPRPTITPRPLAASPNVQRQSTLPASTTGLVALEKEDSKMKSATLPAKPTGNKVSALANKFIDDANSKPEATTFKSVQDDAVVRRNTVKKLAKTIQIPLQPIGAILPENSRMKYIIPNRKKIEPRLPARRRTSGNADGSCSDDTLDTSDEEKVPEPILPSPSARSAPPPKDDCSTQKLRVMTDNEVKERDKKWETKSGWLWKQGGRRNNRGWKKRWFVFEHNTFTYYTCDKRDAESLSCIALSTFKEVRIAQTEKDNSRQKFPFELITKHREYLLSAETSEERTLWCSILMIAITQYKGSILDDLLGGAMNNPDKAGELRKQGNSRLRDWKNRYCAVKDGTFCYYESYEAYCIATPITSIYCGTLKAQISDRTRFKFEVIVPNRTYYFMAKSEAEMLSWIDALTKAVSAALTDLKSSGSTAKELISRIYEEPSNAFCADCRAPDPKWASINLGVVVCIKCSGSHRILGVHISKVRSLELDVKAWTDDMISVFHRIGNQRANNFFESTLDRSSTSHPSPDSDMKVREAFIEDKYTRGTWSAVIKAPVEELDRQLLQVVQTDELHKTLALLMSGANVKHIDKKQDSNRRTPYLMALASGQKAQAQLLLLNDADPVPPEQAEDVPEQDSMLFDLEGDLDKKGPNAMQSYKKRHCLLSVHGKCMRYYDDHSFKNEIDLRTMIEVTLDDSENPDEEKNTEGYTFLRLRTDTRTYLFRDRDKEYMTTWYQSIRSTQVFGTPLENQPKTHNGIPILIHKCIMFLDTRTDVEGLYRISGAKNRIEKLKLQFNQNVHDVVLSDESTVTHDVTSVLKQYFRELPVSLLGPSNEQLTAAVQIADETEKLYQIQDIIYELPGTEFHVLKFVIQHLYAVAGQQALNKMSSENLGVVFGPTLMSTHEEGKEFNPYEYHLVTTLIDYFPWLFQVDVEMEESKGKELKLAEAELKKIMSQLDAPRGSVDNSWIVEMFHQQNSVNIRIESGQTLRDVSAEILFRAKLVDGDSDYSLSEFLCDGQLQRPIHLSEYLLNTTVTLWEERVQKSWLAIDNNSIKEKLRKFDPPQDNSTEQGTLHIYEGKKKWKEVHCKISSDNFTYSKLKVKSTINLLNYTWYLGCESSLAPPNGPRHCFTLRCLTPKDHKDDIFKVFSASDENELWRWIFRINYVKFKEPDYRLVRSKRATLQNPNNRNSFLLLEHR